MRVGGIAAWMVCCATSHASPDGFRDHTGTSAEAQVGAGDVYATCHESGCTSNAYPLTIVGGSIGRWLAPQLDAQLRVFDVLGLEGGNVDNLVLVAPGIQFWPSTQLWLGAAAGADIFAGKNTTAVTVGFDFRAGVVVFTSGAHALSLSADISPAVSSDNVTTIAVTLAYQYL